MTRVPRWLLRHRVVIEPYEGDGAYGPTYGPPVEVSALVSEVIRLIRSQAEARSGRTITSTAQLITAPDVVCPAESRITLPDGRITRALTVAHHTAPGLPVPQSVEVMCE